MLDVVVAATALVALSPLLLALAVAVAAAMGRPVMFRQPRAGLNGRPFMLWKFRTMTDERGPDGALLPDDRRLTRFGRFLRSSTLDEVPALWNVLKGEMSLVGPRPLFVEYTPLYTPEQARRLVLRPGLTGWAAVRGRNSTTWTERFLLDTWYVDNVSFMLDARILLLTVGTVFSRRDINQPGHATMPRFTGEERAP